MELKGIPGKKFTPKRNELLVSQLLKVFPQGVFLVGNINNPIIVVKHKGNFVRVIGYIKNFILYLTDKEFDGRIIAEINLKSKLNSVIAGVIKTHLERYNGSCYVIFDGDLYLTSFERHLNRPIPTLSIVPKFYFDKDYAENIKGFIQELYPTRKFTVIGYEGNIDTTRVVTNKKSMQERTADSV